MQQISSDNPFHDEHVPPPACGLEEAVITQYFRRGHLSFSSSIIMISFIIEESRKTKGKENNFSANELLKL